MESLPSRERGLKLDAERKTAVEIASLPSRERDLDHDISKYAKPPKMITLNIRVVQQQLDRSDALAPYRGIRIAVQGKMKSFSPGVLRQGGKMGCSVILELFYILVEINKETKLELDKFNQVQG